MSTAPGEASHRTSNDGEASQRFASLEGLCADGVDPVQALAHAVSEVLVPGVLAQLKATAPPGETLGLSLLELDATKTEGVLAKRRGNRWVLEGARPLVVNGVSATSLLVTAADRRGPGASVSTFLVPASLEGLSREHAPVAAGLEPCGLETWRFDACVVEDDALVGEAGAGTAVTQWLVGAERSVLLGAWIGALKRSLTELGQELERTSSKSSQAVRLRFADAVIAVEVAARAAARATHRFAQRAADAAVLGAAAKWAVLRAATVLPEAVRAVRGLEGVWLGAESAGFPLATLVGSLGGGRDALVSVLAQPEGPSRAAELSAADATWLAEFQVVCRDVVAAGAAEVDRDARLDPVRTRAVAEAGYAKLFVPSELGGTGASGALTVRAMVALARACPSTYWSATFSAGICGKMVSALGTAEQHRRFIGPLMRGESLGSFPVVERGSPSDPSTLRATLRPSAGGYRLDGEKLLVVHAPNADVAAVMVHGPKEEGGGLRFAFVDLHRTGVRRSRMSLVGLKGLALGGLRFEGVEVPKADVAPIDYEKFVRALEWGQAVIVAGAVGVGRALLESSWRFAQERQSFGANIETLAAVRERLAEMRVEVELAETMLLEVAKVKDGGQPAGELIQAAKVHASESSVTVAQHALQLHGAWGLTPSFGIERLVRDALTQARGGMANDRIRDVLAGKRLGVDVSAIPVGVSTAPSSPWLDERIDAALTPIDKTPAAIPVPRASPSLGAPPPRIPTATVRSAPPPSGPRPAVARPPSVPRPAPSPKPADPTPPDEG